MNHNNMNYEARNQATALKHASRIQKMADLGSDLLPSWVRIRVERPEDVLRVKQRTTPRRYMGYLQAHFVRLPCNAKPSKTIQ